MLISGQCSYSLAPVVDETCTEINNDIIYLINLSGSGPSVEWYSQWSRKFLVKQLWKHSIKTSVMETIIRYILPELVPETKQ